MRASAAFVLDRANEYRADLKPAEFEGLMTLADRMADHRHAAYGKTQNPCTNADYWTLKCLIAAARARQSGADAARQLAPILTWMHASLTPPPRSWKKAQDVPSEVCIHWRRSLRVQLNDALFPVGDVKSDQAFFDACLALVPRMLDACKSMARTHPWNAAPALENWAATIEANSAALGREPAEDAALARSAATRARQQFEEARR